MVLVQSGSGEVLSGRGLMEVTEWDENRKGMVGEGGWIYINIGKKNIGM